MLVRSRNEQPSTVTDPDIERRVRRRRRPVVGVGAAVLLALIAGGIAIQQRNAARDAVSDAELATLISESAAVADDDTDLSILLALEAHRRAPGAASERAVLRALVLGTTSSDEGETTSALVEQTLDLSGPSTPLFGDGSVVVTDPVSSEVEQIDLRTGRHVPLSLGAPSGIDFEPVAAWSEGNDVLALSADGQFARWTDGEMVDRIHVPSEDEAFLNGADWTHDRMVMGAGLGQTGSSTRSKEWNYLNTASGAVEVLATVADTAAVAAVAIGHGGFRLFREDGLLHSYDPTGAITSEIDTGLQRPPFPLSPNTIAAGSEGDRLVAFGNGAGVVIVDTATGTTTQVPTFGGTESLLFARGDSVLMVGSDDGTVRAWDVELNVSRGVLWRGPAAVTFATWYDDETDSLWIAEEQRLLELTVDPDVHLQRACDLVDRELTQVEWDRYVPGGGPVRSACS